MKPAAVLPGCSDGIAESERASTQGYILRRAYAKILSQTFPNAHALPTPEVEQRADLLTAALPDMTGVTDRVITALHQITGTISMFDAAPIKNLGGYSCL